MGIRKKISNRIFDIKIAQCYIRKDNDRIIRLDIKQGRFRYCFTPKIVNIHFVAKITIKVRIRTIIFIYT